MHNIRETSLQIELQQIHKGPKNKYKIEYPFCQQEQLTRRDREGELRVPL